MGEFATVVEFHHVNIPIQLRNQIEIADKPIQIINLYASNIHKVPLMHYREDHLYTDETQAQAYADLLTHQNQFVQNSSASILIQIKDFVMLITEALRQSSQRLKRRQLELLFSLIVQALGTTYVFKTSNLGNRTSATDQKVHTLTHISEMQENQLHHLDLTVLANQKITLEGLRYNPAMLATAANALICHTAIVANKIQATVQQAQTG